MIRRSATTVAIFIAAVVALPGVASAKWAATGAGTAQVGAATMRNGTALTATCLTTGIQLNWTASLDAFVVSYTVTRTIDGVSSPLASPSTTGTTLTDTITTGNATVRRYAYTITAVRQQWTAGPSASVSKGISFSANGNGNGQGSGTFTCVA
jgi:hypothetical protein